MFTEFQNQVWTVSAGATVTNNTDESVDGSSKKIVFTATDAWALNTFTSFTGSNFEEIGLWLYQKQTISNLPQFKITLNSIDYEFNRLKEGWNHILFDCSTWSGITTLKITALVDDLTLFYDLSGYRKASYDSIDLDIIEAIKSTISLNYGVTTTLSAEALAGARSISLVSKAYINNTTLLQITDGVNTENVKLQKQDGTLKTALVNTYAAGSTVTALCPVISEEDVDYEPNPVCGITIVNTTSEKEEIIIQTKGITTDGIETVGGKLKRFLGTLQILIYIDCSSIKKLLSLTRQFDDLYGREFRILLDGEIVLCQIDNVISNIDIDAGTLPRKAYFYTVQPQPITVSSKRAIETINLTPQSEVL